MYVYDINEVVSLLVGYIYSVEGFGSPVSCVC